MTSSNVAAAKNEPDFEALLSVRIKKIADMIEKAARREMAGTMDLGFAEARIIAYLASRGHSAILEIGRDLSIDKAWISRLLRKLVQKGLVQRTDQGGGRIARINLTEQGNAVHRAIRQHSLRHYDMLLVHLDQPAAHALLDQLEANLLTILDILSPA